MSKYTPSPDEIHAARVKILQDIPTITGVLENIAAIARFLKANHKDATHLLPYHNLGEAKLTRIDTGLRPMHLENVSEGHIKELAAKTPAAAITPPEFIP